jgi:very-short-patch-repair endonuclease
MSVLEILRPVLENQGSCLRYGQTTTLGVSRRQLRTAVSAARLERLRRGVYGIPAEHDRLAAAQLATTGVVSHTSAAKHLGIGLAFDDPDVHLTFPRNYGRGAQRWAVSHRSDLRDDEIEHVAGLRCTTAIRTVIDLAGQLPVAEAVAAADSALREGRVTLAELESAVAATRPRAPGSKRVRRVLELVDPKAGSVLESLLRVLLVLHGLAPEHTQYVVRDRRGGYLLRADFVWTTARLVVEADGYEHHGADRTAWGRDLKRGNQFTAGRWWLLRFTWDDVINHPDEVVEQVREMLTG